MKHTIESLGWQFAENSVSGGGAVAAVIHGQVTKLEKKLASNQKPYYDLELSDGAGVMKLKVWNNSPAFPQCATAEARMKEGPLFLALDGMFRNGEYGFESNDFRLCSLNDEAVQALFKGTAEQQAKVEAGWKVMMDLVNSIQDEVLRLICQNIAQVCGEDFKRAAAARGRHHARRGGLVEHVSMMMKSADVICTVYPQLNRSLLLAGTFLHDIGKLVENQYEIRGFNMPFTSDAELFGHIAIGVEYVRSFAKQALGPRHEIGMPWEFTVDCLCHLILSHHGQHAWGSPVEPKIPEAAALHYIDNMDAKLETMRAAYAAAGDRKPGDVIEKVWPMPSNLVVPPKEDFSTQPLTYDY